jgi:hypothetical protein
VDLLRSVRRNPNLQEAGMWKNGKPPNGMSPPFPDAPMIEKISRSLCIEVRIDPRNDGMMRLDDQLMKLGET